MPSTAGVSDGSPILNDVPTQLLQDFMAEQPEPPDPATSELDEALKLKLGIATLHSLDGIDANEVQTRANREYARGNLQLWRSNLKKFGLQDDADDPLAKKPGDDMGHTVRVDSDDKHFHYHPPPVAPVKPDPEPVKPTPESPSLLSKLLPWIVAGTLGAGGVGLGVLLAGKDDPPAVTDTDTDTRSTLRPYTGDDPVK